MRFSPPTRAASGLAAAVLATGLLAGAGAARAQLPADIVADIQYAAADVRRQAEQDRQVSQRMQSIGMVPIHEPADAGYAGDVMGAAVISAIARRPDLAGPIVAAAVAAAPEARDGIVDGAATAFPAFAATVHAAAGPATAGAAAPAYAPPAQPQGQVVTAMPAADLPAPPAGVSAADMAPDAELEMEPVDGSTGAIDDPWEGFNRGVFAFNDVVDRFFLKPVATAYGWVLPEPVKQSVRNGVANVMSPVVLANDLLQFEFRDAAVTLSRLIANSTMGIGGLFDVASGMGLPPHPADFGQTLHSYGVDSGPYLVLPLLGPSSVRDGVGQGVDVFMHPFTYVLATPVNMGVTGGRAVVRREALLEPLDELREGSLDYYAALRSAYVQDRAVVLRRGQPADTSEVDEMFDAFE